MTGRDLARRLAVIAGVGLATGAITQMLQSLLPGSASQLANAISPWLLVAFLLGATMPATAWAAGAGVGSLVFALIGYYGLVQLRFGYGGGTSSWLFWGSGALVGGFVFGVAGRWWRHDPSPRRRAAALGLLGAVFIAEGLYHALVLDEPAVAAAFAIVGLVLPGVLGRSRDDRLGGYVAIAPALALGAVGYVVFLGLYGVLTGVG